MTSPKAEGKCEACADHEPWLAGYHFPGEMQECVSCGRGFAHSSGTGRAPAAKEARRWNLWARGVPADCPQYVVAANDYDALRQALAQRDAEIARLREVLTDTTAWLECCLKCKDWRWDGDQRAAAEECVTTALTTISERK